MTENAGSSTTDRIVVVRTLGPDSYAYVITGGGTETLEEARANATLFTGALAKRAIRDEAIAAGAVVVGQS